MSFEGRKIRWGLSSTGRIADWFATDFSHVTGGEIVAVASRSKERAQAFAERFGIPRAHGCYRDLLEDDQVDVVYVATPHSLHAENVRDALEAGKAVLCEKPLTVTPEETEMLIATAEATGGYLMEAMWTYFLPALQTAQRWVEEGRIGRIVHIKADFGYPQTYHPRKREYDAQLGGGALLEMGVYPVALAWFFLGRSPSSLQVTARQATNGVEDDLVAIFDYLAEGGQPSCTATLGTSYRCKLQNWAYVLGEDGYIAIPDFWRANECYLYQLDQKIDSFADGRQHQGFCYEANAVNDDLTQGRRQSEIVPLATSLEIQRQMARIRRCFEPHHPVGSFNDRLVYDPLPE